VGSGEHAECCHRRHAGTQRGRQEARCKARQAFRRRRIHRGLGLARGIDTVAHTTAVAEGGYTIAVLGTPITESYPAENRELQRQIADRYLVISQVPIVRYANQHFRGKTNFFPERNVTMSALTKATVIVEAGETSGTLVQARHALKQKRQLFILDSCFRNESLRWPQKFEGLGAIRVSDYADIKSHLAAVNPKQALAD
jgi:DNA processing protein